MANNLTNMNAFNDVFQVIASYLNPGEHCQAARVCKRLQTIITDIWLQQQHDTVENRTWIAKFYQKQTNDLDQKIENSKAGIKQTLFQVLLLDAHASNTPLETFEQNLLSLQIDAAVDSVFNKHKQEIELKFTNIWIQSLVHCLSIAQIKKFIEWQQDADVRPIIQKMSQNMPMETSESNTIQMHNFIQELQTEIVKETEKLAATTDQKEPIPALLMQEKEEINNQTSDIDTPNQQEDTPENRLSCAELLLNKTTYFSNQIESLKQISIASFLSNLAHAKKIELHAVTDATRNQVAQLFNKVFKSQQELIQTHFRQFVLQEVVNKYSTAEIKTLISLHQNPMHYSAFRKIPQVWQYFSTINSKFLQNLTEEILKVMGCSPQVINK